MVEVPPDESRRVWLLRSLKGAISATVIAVLYPVACFLRPRRATVAGAMEVVAPFTVNKLPGAADNPFDFGGKPCLVVLAPSGLRRLKSGEPLRSGDVRAFNALCTHVDCTVEYRPDQADIFCNCHGGVYDLNGKNISGPPPRPLETYKVDLRGDPDNPGKQEIIVSRKT